MTRAILPILALSLAGALAGTARAETTTLRRDTVVPVLFESTIDLGIAREGDTFTARVDGGRDLPRGSRLRGRVERVRKASSGVPGSVVLRFDEVRLPDGERTAIDAVPVPLNADFLKRNPDGRIVARRNDRSRETKVLGGLLGGFAIGSIFHKQAEGAILGTVLGAAAAVADKDSGREIAVRAGARYGALFQRDVTLDVRRDGLGRGDDANPRRPVGVSGGDPYDAIRRDGRRDDPLPENRAGSRAENRGAGRGELDARDPALRVYRGERELVYRADRPFVEGDALWVPAEETARLLGLRVVDAGQRPFYIDSEAAMLKIDEARDRIVVDGRVQEGLRVRRRTVSGTGDARPREVVFVPVSAFSPLVQEKITFRRVL